MFAECINEIIINGNKWAGQQIVIDTLKYDFWAINNTWSFVTYYSYLTKIVITLREISKIIIRFKYLGIRSKI